MDGCCHGDNLRILLSNRHKFYSVTANQIVSMTINRACASGFLGYHHGNIHPSIPVLSPSFLYHPYIPSFESKDFSFTIIIGLYNTEENYTEKKLNLEDSVLMVWKL